MFLFTYFYVLSSSNNRMIYRSLEMHFHIGSNAIEIVGVGSIVMEIFTYQVQIYGYIGVHRGECFRTPQMASSD